MKPAARDQDIPRGAGSGAPEASETPGGAHRAGRKARRARQRENHRSDPPSRLPSPPPPGASTNAAGARFSGTDSTVAPSKSPRSKQREAAAGLSPLYCLNTRPPRPPACPPPSLPSFPPSLLCPRPRAPPPALRLRLRRPRLRPLPILLHHHAHASTYAARQPEAPPSAPFSCAYWTEETRSLTLGSCYGWFPLPWVSTKAAFDWVNLEKEAG